jgi:adenine deaminase
MNSNTKSVSGQIVDIINRTISGGTVFILNGRIDHIEKNSRTEGPYILPGFTDAHIHIESSMLVPYEFARLALPHGTVSTVSDPHEIANVSGVEGVKYMLENARDARLKFHFGAPSCVPATGFETAGAEIDSQAIEELMARDDIFYLSEMMNYPGVLFKDPEVMRKLEVARLSGKPIDGHAPGLRGEEARLYASHGITTDHECFTLEEALDKISCGMKILIREGSAARNYDALHPLLGTHPKSCMLCSDDMHPDELMLGHINRLVARSIALGYDLFDVLEAACVHPVMHYSLRSGLLREGDPADFIVVNNLVDFVVQNTFIDGECVAENGRCTIPDKTHSIINRFADRQIKPSDFQLKAEGTNIRVIDAHDGQLVTSESIQPALIENGLALPDPARDILKIAVVNRYNEAPPATAFIRNFGIRRGAIASSVAHDSHNIIVVGTDDRFLAEAVNLVMENKGGLSAVDDSNSMALGLPVAGLMSNLDGQSVGRAYAEIDRKAKEMGSSLRAPFMSLSFMALLVIPQLKLSDKGLFDGAGFRFSPVFV